MNLTFQNLTLWSRGGIVQIQQKKSKTKGNLMLLSMVIKKQQSLSNHNKRKSNISAVHLIHDNLLSSGIYKIMAALSSLCWKSSENASRYKINSQGHAKDWLQVLRHCYNLITHQRWRVHELDLSKPPPVGSRPKTIKENQRSVLCTSFMIIFCFSVFEVLMMSGLSICCK